MSACIKVMLVANRRTKIRISSLVSNEPLSAPKMLVQHTHDALDLVQVTHDCGLDLFGMETEEPGGLPIIRALARHLEEQPLLDQPLLGRSSVGEGMLGVVLLDEVLDDGTRLDGKPYQRREYAVSCLPAEHTSQMVRPVLGSSMAGTRPLGLIASKAGFLTSPCSTLWSLYGMPNSSRKITTFHGLGLPPERHICQSFHSTSLRLVTISPTM